MTEEEKQTLYRDARFTEKYDDIWQNVGKCVFCDLREKYVFFEENGIVMTVSLYAYIDGHFMIMPRRHVRSTKELTQIEWETIRRFSYIAKKLIKKVHGIRGMQFIQKDGLTAQSTVNEHIHFHCVPFDAADLVSWNYRQLRHTPLQNVALYKNARQKIVEHAVKYDNKYRNLNGLRVVCDLIIVNEKKQVLFQERKDWAKLTPDVLSIPGGLVDNFSSTLEVELTREVQEETGWLPDASKVKLAATRISHLKRPMHSTHLNAKYLLNRDFLWVTYAYTGFDSSIPLTPGDDCEALLWIDIKEVATHPKIADALKETVLGIPL